MALLRKYSFDGSIYRGPNFVDKDDYGYITKRDALAGDIGVNRDGNSEKTQDDVLYFMYNGDKHRSCFPPYSISERGVTVGAIRQRAGLILGINDDALRNAKFSYKNKDFGNSPDLTAIAEFGVKNKSEIVITVPAAYTKSKKSKKGSGSDSEHTDSGPKPLPKAGTPLEQVNVIEEWFDNELEQLCRAYIKAPPTDPKARDQEWRRLSETTMQHVTLKLDAVEPNGDANVRARRKQVTKRVEGIMKELDEARHST